MRRTAVLLAVVALVLSTFPAATLAAPSSSNSWIVTLRADVDAGSTAQDLARQHGGSVGFVYRHALNGFSFRGSAAAATALSRNPKVTMVEADAEVWLDTTQLDATWGLDRIDQRTLPLSDSYTYTTTGDDVTVYVIDSGIRYSHQEFGSRARLGTDVVGGVSPAGSDCNGHGTHVAGTIGGATYGVAKAVDLVSVRVFGCSGGSSWSTIIAGVDWVTQHARKPAVANLSLGGGASFSADNAVKKMIASGVGAAIAAGNSGANACNYSPARVGEAMTIGATTTSDAKASWSNYGSCVDWFAPGAGIQSAGIGSDTGTATKSGTSMATPHTAGVAALYLHANPNATPAEVRTALYDATTQGIVTSSSTANNHLLYSGFIGGGGGGDTAPTAQFSANPFEGTAPLTVKFTDGSTGSPTSWAWDFGDGGISNETSPSHTYTTAGTYSVTLTVSNATGSHAESKINLITVSEPPPPTTPTGISLDVDAYKVRGAKTADLTWSGATSANVDVYRNGSVVVTTANDEAHTDTTGKGGGTYIYKVCESGTSTCSNEASVSY